MLAWDMDRWGGALPNPGGLWDQPLGLMERARVAQSVYDAVYAFNTTSMKGSEFTQRHPALWRVAARFFELMAKPDA